MKKNKKVPDEAIKSEEMINKIQESIYKKKDERSGSEARKKLIK